MYACIRCLETADSLLEVCPDCHSAHTFFPTLTNKIEKEDAVPKPKVSGKSASELLQKNVRSKLIEGLEELGPMPSFFTMLLHGKPGSGKSTFAIEIAAILSQSRATAYILTEERMNSLTLRNKLVGIVSNKLQFVEFLDYENVLSYIDACSIKNVFIDSVGMLSGTDLEKIEFLKAMREAVPGCFCFVQHSRRAGGYKGNSWYAHVVDIEIEVKEGKATVNKNRLGKAYFEMNKDIFERLKNGK